jgi:hypothetical protein
MSSAKIPLEVLKIENPCAADWGEMRGDERTRFCLGCRKHVHNLSAMSRDEAERLICESALNLCIRMTFDSVGAVVTVDYAGDERRQRRRGWRFWTGVGLLGALLSGGLRAYWAGPRSLPTTVLGDMRPFPTTLPATAPTTVPSPAAPDEATSARTNSI